MTSSNLIAEKAQYYIGEPPSLGWWPTFDPFIGYALRWWNGFYWSRSASPMFNAVQASERAQFCNSIPHEIKWAHRPADWPERSHT